MMRRVLYLALIPAVAIGTTAGNDVLYLLDGHEHVGQLLSVTPDEVIFQLDGDDAPTTFAQARVQRIDLSKRRVGDEITNVDQLDDPLLQRLIEDQPLKVFYPDSGYVTLYRVRDYTLDEDGSYTCRERRVEKILLERGKSRANVARYFKKGEQTLDIDFARTVNPDGSITPISDSAVDVSSVNADTPEYEKLYQVKFAMKQVKEGSIIDWQITRRYAPTDLLDSFHTSVLFQEDEPIIEAELIVRAPHGRSVALREDRLRDNITYGSEETDTHVVHHWVATQCPRVVPEPLMPPDNDFYPCVTVAEQASWEAIGDAYAAALRPNETPSAAIQAQVATLIADLDDPEQRAKAVYHYFIEAIHQQHISPGEYSYVPHPVGEVFERRAGNSIDKCLLLCVMLREAGVPASMVLTRAQGWGRLVEDIPGITQFDSALVAVDLPTERVYLPVTRDTLRFGQLPSGYQGTRGLLVNESGGQLVDIPLKAPDEELHAIAFEMRLDASGDMHVVRTDTFAGNVEAGRRSGWKDRKDEDLRRGFEMAISTENPKAHLTDYRIDNLHDVTKPLRLVQEYTLEGYAMRAGDDLLVFQLPTLDYTAGSVGKPARDYPMRWYVRSKTTRDMTITIPPGFKVYHAGTDYEADCGIVSFVARFTTSDDGISYHDEFVQHELEASRKRYGSYKACMETRARVPKEWIVLERAED